MKNNKTNPEKQSVFTEENIKKQLESICKHLGGDTSAKVEETFKKITENKIK